MRARAVAVQIDENVEAVLAQLAEQRIERCRRQVLKIVECRTQAFAQRTAIVRRRRIAMRAQCRSMQAFDQFGNEQRGGMFAEAGREKTHAQGAVAARMRPWAEAFLQRLD